MILLHVRDNDRGLCASRVRIVLGLTLAEAELAVALAEGETLDEYSVRRELSIHTVRWTLKQAMAKTETHRQAEFVGKVLRDVARL